LRLSWIFEGGNANFKASKTEVTIRDNPEQKDEKFSIVKDHVSGEKLITSVSVGHRLKPPTRFSKGKIAKNRITWFYFEGVAEKGYWYRAD